MQIQTHAAGGNLLDPAFPMDPRELYDFLMARIEPNLLSMNIRNVDAQYEGESEEEREDRYDHYRKAFAIFDASVRDIAAMMEADVRALKEEMKTQMLSEEKEETSRAMQAIEDTLEHSDFRA